MHRRSRVSDVAAATYPQRSYGNGSSSGGGGVGPTGDVVLSGATNPLPQRTTSNNYDATSADCVVQIEDGLTDGETHALLCVGGANAHNLVIESTSANIYSTTNNDGVPRETLTIPALAGSSTVVIQWVKVKSAWFTISI